jgi:hypothetical protein
MLTMRQNSLMSISTAVYVRMVLSSPALHRTRQIQTDRRKNSTKFSFARVRCPLDYAKMGQVMLGEASHHAVALLNIIPSRSLDNITPHESANGILSNVSKLRVFGCAVFVPLPHPRKLDNKEARAANLGHIGYVKCRLLLPGHDYRIFIAISVKFDVEVFDFAADSAKNVTGKGNTTEDDDTFSDEMRQHNCRR